MLPVHHSPSRLASFFIGALYLVILCPAPPQQQQQQKDPCLQCLPFFLELSQGGAGMERPAQATGLDSLSLSEAQESQADAAPRVPWQEGFNIQSQAHLEELMRSFMAQSAHKDMKVQPKQGSKRTRKCFPSPPFSLFSLNPSSPDAPHRLRGPSQKGRPSKQDQAEKQAQGT